MSGKHSGFTIRECGFFLDPVTAFLGASPDGLVECSCCGPGVLEIKCPWCAKDADSLEDLATSSSGSKKFCLEKLQTGSLQLSRAHPFYVQCQLQIHVTKRNYCDFVVWNPTGLHVERLMPDQQIIQETSPKAEKFFRLCILPELVGKWFTRAKVLPNTSSTIEDSDDGKWCYCKESKGGTMIGCDNKHCTIKWFHTSCLQIQEPPTGKWLCPSCHPAARMKKGRTS